MQNGAVYNEPLIKNLNYKKNIHHMVIKRENIHLFF